MTPEAAELRDLRNDVFWTEKGHFTMAGVWRAAHLVVGLIAAVSSALAAALLTGEGNEGAAGACSVLSAVMAALLTFLKPRDAADRHLVAGRKLGQLRVELRQCERFELASGVGASALHSRLAALAADKASIDDASPHLPNAAMSLVQRRVQAGAFDDTSATDS